MALCVIEKSNQENNTKAKESSVSDENDKRKKEKEKCSIEDEWKRNCARSGLMEKKQQQQQTKQNRQLKVFDRQTEKR